MTVQELYTQIGGSYDAAKSILQMDKLIGKFIVKFLDDKSFEKLSSSWAAGDLTGTFEGAHAMKGVCANLGLSSLSAAASELAEEFRSGNTRKLSDEEISARIDAIREQYDRSIEGIRAFAAER